MQKLEIWIGGTLASLLKSSLTHRDSLVGHRLDLSGGLPGLGVAQSELTGLIAAEHVDVSGLYDHGAVVRAHHHVHYLVLTQSLDHCGDLSTLHLRLREGERI